MKTMPHMSRTQKCLKTYIVFDGCDHKNEKVIHMPVLILSIVL